MTRQQVIARWENRLAEAEQQLVGGSPRFRWLRRMYARLYRFLLVSYGQRQWRADSPDSAGLSADDSSRMPFVDHTSAETGLHPKTPARIRATLKSVHEANEDRQREGGRSKLSAATGSR